MLLLKDNKYKKFSKIINIIVICRVDHKVEIIYFLLYNRSQSKTGTYGGNYNENKM